MGNGLDFKREAIPQHKEVLNGLFIPKIEKKSKKILINRALEKELEKEIDEYLSAGDS